jgi:putative addiction module CopG family antidote
MDDVTLPPELERFAEEAVAAGRFRDLSAVVAAGANLLRRQEQAHADFVASLEAAEAARDGWHSLDEVLAEANQISAAKRDAALPKRPGFPGRRGGSSPRHCGRWSTLPRPRG